MTCPWSTAFLIVRKSPSHPAAGEDDFAAARLRFSPGYDGREKTYAGSMSNRVSKWNNASRGFHLQESSLYDKLPVG
jgi:hypothetical protein